MLPVHGVPLLLALSVGLLLGLATGDLCETGSTRPVKPSPARPGMRRYLSHRLIAFVCFVEGTAAGGLHGS